MIARDILGSGLPGGFSVFVSVVVFFFVVRSQWRLREAKQAEVRRLALLAAAEDQRVEMEMGMEAKLEYCARLAPTKDEFAVRESVVPLPAVLPMIVCAFCSAPASARCKKCKAVRYCSGRCQIAHWRQGHKDECYPPSINYKSSVQSAVASSRVEQLEQISLINGHVELGGHAPSQVDQTLPEHSAPFGLTSTSDTLHGNNKLEEENGNAIATRSTGYSIAAYSSESMPCGISSGVSQRAASLFDESILNDTLDPPSSHSSPNKPLTAVKNFDLDPSPASTNTYSDVNSKPYVSNLPQNESTPTTQAIGGGLLSDPQPSKTSEHEFVDLGGGKDQNASVSSMDSGSKNQNYCNLPATEESKSQSEHEKTKASSNERIDSSVVSTLNNVESRMLRSTSYASSAGRLSSVFGVDGVAVSRTWMDSASKTPRKLADIKGSVPNGVTVSDRVTNHLTIPRSSHIESANLGPIKSVDDRCPIPNGVVTSVKKVACQLMVPKTMRNYQSELMLFPYDQFIKLYNYNIIALRPCGFRNRGNSCYANAALQCLAFTRPLTAYFLEGFHSDKCQKKEWCLTCEFQSLLARVKKGKSSLSPSGILSHLDDIGGNFSYGRQEDAHEFLRFVVDAMQSACLKEAGVKPGNQLAEETTLIQQTFGGYLQSKIKCSRCKGKSERRERMMDLTVEIDGDVNTLEEALKRFTSYEILDGENKFDCVRCKSYERARKKLTILEAPNILIIALKRFQSGTFGKLNKTVQFPEILDLAPYMSATDDKSPVYRLYAVIVHIDVLNSSQSGHYICYVKDTCDRWYNVDDIKVQPVDLQKVLSEGAYMLFYARCSPRAPSFVRKAMANQSGKLQRSKSNFWGKSGPLLRHLSVPVPAINSFDFQSSDLFDDRIRPVQEYSSDNSSLYSNSDAGSSSTDSTRDSASTDWETSSSGSPVRNSENSGEFTCSPSASRQSSDKVADGQNNNLYSTRNYTSDGFFGRKVETQAEKFSDVNFADRGDYYPSTNHSSPSFLYSNNSKQYRILTENRAVESNFTGTNKVNYGVLSRRNSGRSTQPFY